MESDLIIKKVISEFYEWYTWTNFEEEHIVVEGKAEKKSLEIESRLSVREVEKKTTSQIYLMLKQATQKLKLIGRMGIETIGGR